jgi:hypothetical protein
MEQENELLDLFRKMDVETKDLFLSHGRIALVAGESVKRSIINSLSPQYADRRAAPVGAVLAREAANG